MAEPGWGHLEEWGVPSLGQAHLLAGLSGPLQPQHIIRQLSDVLPGLLHVGGLHLAGADGETQHKLVPEVTRDQVDFPGTVYSFQKRFIQLVGTLEGLEVRNCSAPQVLKTSTYPIK